MAVNKSYNYIGVGGCGNIVFQLSTALKPADSVAGNYSG
jgi:hypothetical protein